MLRSRTEGQALVETAFSMSLLVLMMLGSVEFGRLAYAALEVSNAAKAAAQYGAQNDATALNQAGMLKAAQNEFLTPSAVSLVLPSGSNGYTCSCVNNSGTTTSVSTSSCITNNSLTAPICSSGSYLQVTIQVQTQTTFDPLIHIVGLPTSYTLNGTAQQEVLQ